MSSSNPRRTATRAAHVVAIALGVALTGIIGLLWLASFSAATSFETFLGGHDDVGGTADGELPDGVTAFDDEYPAIANLDPELLDALRRATTDAAAHGIGLEVNSGWRSTEYQEELLREAVEEHGSVEEAARWVSTPETSLHVSGDAVDIGGPGSTAWLTRHGAAYGLCRVYDNEPWHYELRPEAPAAGCPATYADPAHDPRGRP